mgnify:FL=1
MRTKSFYLVVASLLAIVLVVGSFSGGILVGWMLPDKPTNIISQKSTPESLTPALPLAGGTTAPSDNTSALFAPFWDTWQIVHNEYVDQPVDDVALMRGAIKGMLEALGDPHTSYMDPDVYLQVNAKMEGEYEGIGAWVDSTGDYLTIISPMPNSPAENAGLKSGDQIIAVDGQDMTGIDPGIVLKQVLGPAGTPVKLMISREGENQPIEVNIVRSKIITPSAEGKMLEGNIAYVQIYTFGDNTSPELRTALKTLLSQNPKGLIIDLRNNGGGYLQTAIEVASEFINDGVIMYEQYGNGQQDVYKALGGGLATNIPLVVLVNEGTASASEIVSGAIQDYERGKLVGTTTYGKGSVQNWIPLRDDQGAIRVTIAHWLTPQQRQINNVGLTPDVEVKITDADIKANLDTQLQKAIELLSQ